MDSIRRRPRALVSLVMPVLAAIAVSAARAGTSDAPLVVNTTDGRADGACDLTHCSLADAITAANQHSGPDEIGFAIPAGDPGCDAAGVCTIHPEPFLDELLDDGTTIDGFTQSGATPNSNPVGQPCNAVLKIVLDGNRLPACCPWGVLVTGSGSRVRGLAIHRFYTGIQLLDATGTRIEGNFIGTDASGGAAGGNACSGVSISIRGGAGSSNNVVGGETADRRNVISGNGCVGVEIGPSGDNRVLGNYIGTDASGSQALPNATDGVYVFNASAANRIGGTAAGAANLIAFNGGNGVTVRGGLGVARATIVRNRITGNAEKGIALVEGGNDDLPAPRIATVGPTAVAGTACAGCTIEVFSAVDDEGAIYEGTALADGAGHWQLGVAGGLSGPHLTATATDALGNTSEFSAAVALQAPTPTASPTVPITATATAPPPACAGDCGGDGAVTIEDLVRGVNIALGAQALDVCRAMDRDGDAHVTVNELIAAVNAALGGCEDGRGSG